MTDVTEGAGAANDPTIVTDDNQTADLAAERAEQIARLERKVEKDRAALASAEAALEAARAEQEG